MKRAAMFGALVLLAGCGSGHAFLLKPDDSAAMKTAKVAVRVPLAILSFGINEVHYQCVKNRHRYDGLDYDLAAEACRSQMGGSVVAVPAPQQPSKPPRCTTECTRLGHTMRCRERCF